MAVLTGRFTKGQHKLHQFMCFFRKNLALQKHQKHSDGECGQISAATNSKYRCMPIERVAELSGANTSYKSSQINSYAHLFCLFLIF